MFFAIFTAHADNTIVYPRPESLDDERTKYPIKLLELGLRNSETKHVLKPSVSKMQQGRALYELGKNRDVDVVWSMTSIKREKELLPIRIPIYKGLIGWRLLLINEEEKEKFQNIKTLEELGSLKAGQGHDWPDTEILRSNGLKVLGSSKYEGLFKMLALKRFDYFPRSIVEIWAEADKHRSKGIIVEQTIIIQYPTAFYFFVNKGNKKLADDLRKGLEKSIKNGQFDELFHQYHDNLIHKARLDNRKKFKLPNPILPQETLIDKKEYWF